MPLATAMASATQTTRIPGLPRAVPTHLLAGAVNLERAPGSRDRAHCGQQLQHERHDAAGVPHHERKQQQREGDVDVGGGHRLSINAHRYTSRYGGLTCPGGSSANEKARSAERGGPSIRERDGRRAPSYSSSAAAFLAFFFGAALVFFFADFFASAMSSSAAAFAAGTFSG